MRKYEIIQELTDMDHDISVIIDKKYMKLSNLFNSIDSNNEATVTAYDRHNSMAWYTIVSRLSSKYKKCTDHAKKSLDKLALAPDDLEPNASREMYSSNNFVFSKKQNKETMTVVVNDLVTALARAGVEKSVVDRALANSEKVRRGNTYYEVEAIDDNTSTD